MLLIYTLTITFKINIFMNTHSQNSQLLTKWGQFIDEAAPGLKNSKKLFVARVAENAEFINESGTTNISSHGQNTNGIGSINLPTNVDAKYTNFYNQTPGSGDVPVTMLSMAMSVAATTIGFDLLPAVPIYQPSVLLQYIDYIYGGGRLDEANHKPLMVTVKSTDLQGNTSLTPGTTVLIGADTTTAAVASLVFVGFTRLEAYPVFKVTGAGANDATALSDIAFTKYKIGSNAEASFTDATSKFELTRAVENHFGEFSAYGEIGGEGVDRAVAERGTRSVLEMKTYSKLVRTKEHTVEGIVTRQQARDVKAMGLDAMPALKIAMQNELSQSINKEILERMRRLGVSTHLMLQKSQGVNLNLFIGPPATASKSIANFKTRPLFDKTGSNKTSAFADAVNAETNSAAENLYSRQRRIKSRILAAAALVGQVSRWGSADAAVVNTQLLAAIKESKGFQASTIEGNNISQDTKALYYAGEVAGVKLYCDPNLDWNDTSVVVARTGKSSTGVDELDLHEGLVFLPYNLASSVDIIAEGTMSPKCLLESVYSIAEIGIRPELAYFTFVCDNGFGTWV
jgi:hypothetical protein